MTWSIAILIAIGFSGCCSGLFKRYVPYQSLRNSLGKGDIHLIKYHNYPPQEVGHFIT